jgi:hypothetical protein
LEHRWALHRPYRTKIGGFDHGNTALTPWPHRANIPKDELLCWDERFLVSGRRYISSQVHHISKQAFKISQRVSTMRSRHSISNQTPESLSRRDIRSSTRDQYVRLTRKQLHLWFAAYAVFYLMFAFHSSLWLCNKCFTLSCVVE